MNQQKVLRAIVWVMVFCGPVCVWSGQGEASLAEAKTAYEQAGHDLNAAYQQAKVKLSEHAFEDLKARQRGWISYRDYFCDEVIRRDTPELAEADLTQEPSYWQRMSSITKERTAILHAIVAGHRGSDVPLGGRWIDGFGGYLDIVEQDGRIAFDIEVVRGPTHHVGSIHGYAQVSGRLARFDDVGEDDGKGYVRKPAWLTFVRRVDHLELISANAEHYCGARAYFDNDYYRVGDLSEEDRKRVLKRAVRSTDTEG